MDLKLGRIGVGIVLLTPNQQGNQPNPECLSPDWGIWSVVGGPSLQSGPGPRCEVDQSGR